ncbi:hypothetical protein LZ30DRAFT_781456 [Colletotrichum cereale]|nr:hypothetical protein LZ30DRAFT_781456 [Colletotrichum cereale]
MFRLPPVEKPPVAQRKNIRDEWDSKKEDPQKELSDFLGAEWTLSDIHPSQLYPYARDGYAKPSLGSSHLKCFLKKNVGIQHH